FFGTNTFAAPGLGILGAILVFGLRMLWLERRQRQLARAGESFADPTEAELKEARRHGDSGPITATTEMAAAAPSRETEETGPSTRSGKGVLAGLIGLSPVLIIVLVNALCTYGVFPAMDVGYLSEEKFGATS